MLNNIRVLILLCCTAAVAFSASTDDIDKRVREGSTVDLTQGTKVTNMPYGYYVSEFGKSSIKGYDKMDLSGYKEKKLLVGYGVYDVKGENCRYLDVPSNAKFDLHYKKRFTINDTTYAISRVPMTYTQCKSNAAQYSGFVFTPKNKTEAIAVSKKFGTTEPMWIGYSKPNCQSSYLNDEGYEQSFEFFSSEYRTDKRDVCRDDNRFTHTSNSGYLWKKSDSNEIKNCAIKFNSPDYLRPIKICMPWWKVQRRWKLDKNDDKFEYGGRKYDMAYMEYIMDYAKNDLICSVERIDTNVTGTFKSTIRTKVKDLEEGAKLKFEDTVVACQTPSIIAGNDYVTTFNATCVEDTETTVYDYLKNEIICTNTDEGDGVSTVSCLQRKKTFIGTCNTYSSRKISPVCLDNINDAICQVNECKGFYENSCTKKGTYKPFKDYDIGYILVDGAEIKTKVKDNKRINSYLCPQATGAIEDCLKKEEVTVFPAHCPGTFCDDLSACIKGENSDPAQCLKDYPCEKSYGSSDNVVYGPGGVATSLRGICSDGQEVFATIELKKRTTKRCLQFNSEVLTTESYKSCQNEAVEIARELESSITANDLYSLDERCVRINNLNEARPSIPTVFEYKTKGFFKTTIQKAYIDGSIEDNEAPYDTEYMINTSQKQVVFISKALDIGGTIVPSLFEQQEQFCTDTFSEDWINKRYFKVQELGIKGVLKSESGGVGAKCKNSSATYNAVKDRCELSACSGTFSGIKCIPTTVQ